MWQSSQTGPKPGMDWSKTSLTGLLQVILTLFLHLLEFVGALMDLLMFKLHYDWRKVQQQTFYLLQGKVTRARFPLTYMKYFIYWSLRSEKGHGSDISVLEHIVTTVSYNSKWGDINLIHAHMSSWAQSEGFEWGGGPNIYNVNRLGRGTTLKWRNISTLYIW